MISTSPAAVDAPVSSDPSSGASPDVSSPTATYGLVGLCALLLLVGTWFDGAFTVTDWGPIAIFVLGAVVVLGPGERPSLLTYGFGGVLGLFALWTLLSNLWSDAPSFGMESAMLNIFYAGIALLVTAAVPRRAEAVTLARALVLGMGLLVLATLVLLTLEGKDLLLAGRLDTPVGYRNGAAAAMAMGAVALLCTAAPRERNALVRAGAFAMTVAALGLGFLTQSRGVVLGLGAGIVLILALGPDRLRRAWLAIVAVGFVAAVSGQLLEPYDAFIARARVEPSELGSALAALWIAVLAAFLLMALVAMLDDRLRHRGSLGRWLRPAGGVALAILVLGAAGAGLARTGNPISYVDEKITEFKTLEPAALGATRLGSTSGQRYDLWRIAVRAFKDDPLIGAGEGSYPTRYYRERSTDRNLTVAHSVVLGTLGDSGAIGLLLLLGAFAAAVYAVARRWRHAERATRIWASAPLGAGAVLVAQATVDWLWSIAALTGLAILSIALGVRVLTASGESGPRAGMLSRVSWRLSAGLSALLAVCLFVSADFTKIAREHRSNPPMSLSAARTAQRFAPFAVEPRYLAAGALESDRRASAARQELMEALDLEPRSFVTMTLLGDLELRAGNAGVARSWYRRALALNPRDIGLRVLAQAQ